MLTNSLFLKCVVSRSVHPPSDFGLGVKRSSAGHVREQPFEWTHHLCWTHPPESMGGSQWLRRHPIRHHLGPHPEAKQVLQHVYEHTQCGQKYWDLFFKVWERTHTLSEG